MVLTAGGLFSGIGGFELGLRDAGMNINWVVEQHPKRRACLRANFPEAQVAADVEAISWWWDLGYVDVMCGGFPCQDVSNAGNRGGIDAARSGLWSYFHHAVRVVRPRYVIVENVSGLRSLGMGRVLGDLSSSGYDAEWESIPARAFGAPHVRDRVWIVAYRPDVVSVDTHRALAHARLKCHALRGVPGLSGVKKDVREEYRLAHARHRREARAYQERELDLEPIFTGESLDDHAGQAAGGWRAEPRVVRVVDGLPNRVDRLRALGDALVPAIPRYIGRRILEREAKITELAA